ncbi:GDP-fucose protein O-fucosyltransferase [Arabidopsis thaliana x Arabidopsis arenosa]|uniref:O-fucosyltransferase family protein n=1 Tax=Arabidopsis thaliana x Arabidopsis arenosa TaxID=1240361 RepID=A0A8T1XFP1_9BRAS|nr:GDP-fucose protein O-fucosyltransferase [Arabidopsis thaliana x Arabidopsis arenosa]
MNPYRINSSPSVSLSVSADKFVSWSRLSFPLLLDQQDELWSPLADQGWKPFTKSYRGVPLPEKSYGFLQVFLDGGLNQQRMGICDAVAVAKIMNVTLVIPRLEVNPVWQDSSSFTDIFDLDHFISVLEDEVWIVRELPIQYAWSTRDYYATSIRATRIKTAPVHSSTECYGIAAVAPFSHRSFDNLPKSIQRLCCKVNFEALNFVPHIRELEISEYYTHARGRQDEAVDPEPEARLHREIEIKK